MSAGSGRIGGKGGNLASRLGRIRAKGTPSVPADASRINTSEVVAPHSNAEQSLPGWVKTGEFLYEKRTSISLVQPDRLLSSYLKLLFPNTGDGLDSFRNDAGDFSSLKSKLVFFDLETTGLSHGAGTVAFMASIARYGDSSKPESLEVTQLLLADYPGEFNFLSRFLELVGDTDPVLVSFNGRCFDSQILITRYLMHGMRPRFLGPETMHLDLLFPARRIWKCEIGSCTLESVEAKKLGVIRENDLPGSEAPDAWFEWIKGGSSARVLRVGEHNLEDCISLARLLDKLNSEIDQGSGRAGLIRALELRRQKLYAESESFLSPLAASGDPVAQKLLAIDLEHRLGNPQRALSIAEELGDAKRIERLKAKTKRVPPAGESLQ